MKLVVKAINLAEIEDATLQGYINNLAILQANGINPIDRNRVPGTLSFPKIGNSEISIALVKAYVNHPLVEITDYPLFIKMPFSDKSTKVKENFPFRYWDKNLGLVLDEEGNVTTPAAPDVEENIRTFIEWKVGNFEQPQYSDPDEEFVIINCQAIGRTLTNSELSTVLSLDGVDNWEVWGVLEYNIFQNSL